jgi:hypothetical protein
MSTLKKTLNRLIALSTATIFTLASSSFANAYAATGYRYYSTGILVNGTSFSKPGHIVATDPSSGVTTSFLPIYYIDSALQKLGITPKWDGETLNLITPSSMQVNYPATSAKGTASNKDMVIEINGRVVTNAPKIAYYDQGNKSTQTTFAPIYYFETAIKCLGITVNWNGTNWSMDYKGTSASQSSSSDSSSSTSIKTRYYGDDYDCKNQDEYNQVMSVMDKYAAQVSGVTFGGDENAQFMAYLNGARPSSGSRAYWQHTGNTEEEGLRDAQLMIGDLVKEGIDKNTIIKAYQTAQVYMEIVQGSGATESQDGSTDPSSAYDLLFNKQLNSNTQAQVCSAFFNRMGFKTPWLIIPSNSDYIETGLFVEIDGHYFDASQGAFNLYNDN